MAFTQIPAVVSPVDHLIFGKADVLIKTESLPHSDFGPAICGCGTGRTDILSESVPLQPKEVVTVTVYVPPVPVAKLLPVDPLDHK